MHQVQMFVEEEVVGLCDAPLLRIQPMKGRMKCPHGVPFLLLVNSRLPKVPF